MNRDFDLPGFLLGEIYCHMDETDKENWSLAEAWNLSHDLLAEGIQADAQEIYEIIGEFIAQDREDAE